MVVETAKNKITLNQIVGQKKESRLIESDIIVNDVKPDVLSVISTNGIVSIYKKEIMEGKVRIDGTINTYIIYLADDEHNSVRSLNTNLEFTQIIDMDNCNENMQIDEDIVIKSFDTKLINGRKLNIKANIETNIVVYSNETIEVITGVDSLKDVQLLNNVQKVDTLIGDGKNKVSIKDTIAIDVADDFAEIMKVRFKIMDEEAKISYNKVLSKADAFVEIMYLTEDDRINTVSTKIPIMGFVDIQDINENCICKIRNVLSNLIIKPNSTEEHSIYIEAEIEVVCNAYETQEVNVIEDLYSITENIELTKKSITIITNREELSNRYVMKENLRIPELNGKVFDIQVNPNMNNIQLRRGKIIYEGNLNLNILLEENNGINTKDVDLPFTFEVTSDSVDENSIENTKINVIQNDFIINEGNIETSIELEFKTSLQRSKNLNIIQQINAEEIKECDMYSMVIYFVKPGDTLWKIAKNFRSTVEDIAKINEISDPNKLNIGQQLYIPRFCKNRIAV